MSISKVRPSVAAPVTKTIKAPQAPVVPVSRAEKSHKVASVKNASGKKVSRSQESPQIPYEGPVSFGGFFTLNLAGAMVRIAANVGNRPIREATVRLYADQMIRGKWDFSLPTIIYEDSELNTHNGQHTLLAFKRAKDTLLAKAEFAQFAAAFRKQRLLVGYIKGIKPETANYVDNGLSRTPADMVARLDFFDLSDYEADLGKNPSAKWASCRKWLASQAQFAAAVLWKRVNGQHPRSSAAKTTAYDVTGSAELLAPLLSDACHYVWKASIASVVEQTVVSKKDSKKTSKKKTTWLPKRIGCNYLAALHVLISSAYGAEGIEALSAIVEALSAPKLTDSMTHFSASPSVLKVLEVFSQYEGKKGSEAKTLNRKFYVLERAVRHILDGDSSDTDWIDDPIERDGEGGKAVPYIDHIGGLDVAVDGFCDSPADYGPWVEFVSRWSQGETEAQREGVSAEDSIAAGAHDNGVEDDPTTSGENDEADDDSSEMPDLEGEDDDSEDEPEDGDFDDFLNDEAE